MSAVLAGGAPRALPWVAATITRTQARTPRLRSIFLRAPTAPHVAGQHLDVRLTAADGYHARRPYSIASAPGAAETELLVESLPGGEVSPWFVDVAAPGDTFEVKGPLGGVFLWRPEDRGPLLLAGGGSGIAPLLSMVRERAARAPGMPTLLLYSVRRFEEAAYPEELDALERADPALRVVIATTRGPAERPGDHEGRFDERAVAEQLARWGHSPLRALVCGPTAFVEAVTGTLLGAGVPASRILAERFGGSAAAA
ncbi:MAG: oxidoreductase [Rhodocyclaceae bacterium]|nr:oxidoreductase [Rhodocyclaceae bacterium]MCA3146528.1 oxidoreductase [Rhodocyclaceae bacterium]MCE2899566.1 FAD-binding oxidoreductase [Betaproteobacteria bacterium]